MFEGGAGKMSLDELRILENNLEVWMYHIRSAKVRFDVFILLNYYIFKTPYILKKSSN